MSIWGMATARTPIGHSAHIGWLASVVIFYVPGDSTKAQALEANAHNQRLLEQIPMTETERKALAGDQIALEQIVNSCTLPNPHV
jgi:hypothetical protein